MDSVVVKEVSKKYGKTLALSEASLVIPSGSIFGLLGVNGAGKTTLMKSILGLVRISHGEILIEGKSYDKASSREHVSYLPERFSFFPFYTVKSTLDFYADLHSIHGEQRKNRQESALSKLNIQDLSEKKIKSLSKGQLQRVGLAAMIFVDSQILFLDEPFSGLDPIGIKDLKELLKDLKNLGKTVIMSTHILAEVELLCDHIAIIDHGKVVSTGATTDLVKNETLENYFYQLIKKGGQE